MPIRSPAVTLEIGGKAIINWDRVRVTRSCERCPSDFDISMGVPNLAEPGIAPLALIEGSPCVLKADGVALISGYVDVVERSISATEHRVRVTGRSKCQDLVDSSAMVPAMVVQATTLQDLATKLTGIYGIKVDARTTVASKQVQQFNVNLAETVYEIVEQAARWAGVLIYDNADGDLVLADVGTEAMSSGFVLGQNIEALKVVFSAADRFTKYRGVRLSIDPTGQYQGGVTTGEDVGDPNTVKEVLDKSFPKRADGNDRFRSHVIVSEQVNGSDALLVRMVDWEMNRRNGRGQRAVVTTDSWWDSAGRLWEPNCLAPISAPLLNCAPKQPLTIAEVTYSFGEDGTHAAVTLMPSTAFEPEPALLYQFDAQIDRDTGANPS